MRIQLRSGILAVLLAIPVLASAQTGPFKLSPIDAPGSSPDGSFVCPNGGVTLLDQPPNQVNGFFSDDDCDFCGTGEQSIADNFSVAAETNISQVVLWGGYFPTNAIPAVPAPFIVIFHEDLGAGPGAVVDGQIVTASSHTTTGVVLFGVQEVEVVLDLTTVTLPAGNYWLEIFTTTAGSTDSWFWETGNNDPVNGGPSGAFSGATPGVTWFDTGGFEFSVALCEGENAPPEQARFFVTKDFDDNNDAEVEVTLSCNTGLPLEQTTTISEGDPVNFVIGDFEQGALNCEVTEVTVDGYTASYFDGDTSDENCSWEGLNGGQYVCEITNSLNQSEVEVTKVWIDENEEFNAINVAEAAWSCSNVAFPCQMGGYYNDCDSGHLDFYGNPGVDSFSVYPDWEDGTTCSITEVYLPDGGIEVDDSNCQGLVLFPGDSGSCTIYNTRLYEGIPTLSQYGLAVLALLMLGVGLIGFRRFV
jgi:hypothetical protein